MPQQETCQTCRYWLRTVEASPIGRCRRYPSPVRADASGWCGEWRAELENDEER